MLPREYAAENCSIARILEVLGDRWTLLIVRDALFRHSRRFEDHLERLNIARNVLADRLDRLIVEGILERRLYQERPSRYQYAPTDKGHALAPVMVAMMAWGDRYYALAGPPRVARHAACGGALAQEVSCSACRCAVDPEDVITTPGPGSGDGAGSG